MVARFLRNVVLAAAAGAGLIPAALVISAAVVSAALAPIASADAGPVVSPGMEIRQSGVMCTLGFVDPVARIAFSAGHCNASGPVTDRNGRFIGVVTAAKDNTPDGTVVRTDQVISDYETISLASDVTINSILPGGRTLLADGIAPLAVGQQVCHFGVVTGESCGTIERVNNGWFTMENGVVSQKGDSGGPVYTPTANGKAVMVGLFNSTWGALPAAVSWQATGQQLLADTGMAIVNVAAKN